MKESIKSEIKLAADECCIVFDFGCYFPYTNLDVLTFDFSLGEETFDDYIINHRYPNIYVRTITKKYGRKLSKLGYPYIMKLNEQAPRLLCLRIGIKGIEEKYITLVFLIDTKMTKEKPVCGLSLRFNFDNGEFHFCSHEKVKDGIYQEHRWSNHEIKYQNAKRDILLKPPHQSIKNRFTLIYDDVIEPYPSSISDLLL